MNEQQRIMIEEYMSEVEQLIENIESALPEGTITTEQMAEILQKYSYEESKEEALELCELLLKGVQEGYAYMDTALEQAVEELNEEVPAILEQELEGLSEEEQHQKLLVIYQMLCQQYGKEIDENLAIYLANLSNERLKQDIAVLWEQQGECTFDEVLSLGKERKQSYQLSEKVQSYTSEEQAFVMSTAIFEVLEEKKSNILEPKEVGKQVGMAQRFLEKLKEIANTNILAKGLDIVSKGAKIFCANTLGICMLPISVGSIAYTGFCRLSTCFISGIVGIITLLLRDVNDIKENLYYHSVLLDMNHGKKEIAEQRTGVHFRTIQLIADRDAYEYENQNENENQQEIITFDNNYQQVMEIEEDSRKIEWEEV